MRLPACLPSQGSAPLCTSVGSACRLGSPPPTHRLRLRTSMRRASRVPPLPCPPACLRLPTPPTQTAWCFAVWRWRAKIPSRRSTREKRRAQPPPRCSLGLGLGGCVCCSARPGDGGPFSPGLDLFVSGSGSVTLRVLAPRRTCCPSLLLPLKNNVLDGESRHGIQPHANHPAC